MKTETAYQSGAYWIQKSKEQKEMKDILKSLGREKSEPLRIN